ncbi:hypothetical protein V8G54_037864 (chloroplast) [Vigna mungo]|uniref:Uncharacterized protein n=1 Tax=Vigna mungo TaxID=3915 RepID=A0AAQ3RET2_VIGMU
MRRQTAAKPWRSLKGEENLDAATGGALVCGSRRPDSLKRRPLSFTNNLAREEEKEGEIGAVASNDLDGDQRRRRGLGSRLVVVGFVDGGSVREWRKCVLWGFSGSSAVSATPRFEGSHMASTTPHDQPQWEFSCDMEVDFGSEEHASIVYAALAVDKELQPDKVKRGMTVSDGKLSVHFEATEARFLRASFSAFVDVLTLATKTIEQFGQEMKL